eukprot:366458-Chlamydomonas_euryale.AAC.10
MIAASPACSYMAALPASPARLCLKGSTPMCLKGSTTLCFKGSTPLWLKGSTPLCLVLASGCSDERWPLGSWPWDALMSDGLGGSWSRDALMSDGP